MLPNPLPARVFEYGRAFARAAGLVLGLFASSCGGGGGGGGASGICSMTLSGAVNATVPCQVAAATTVSAGGKVSVGIEGQSGNVSVVTSLIILNQTTLQTGTYNLASGAAVVSAGGTLSQTSGQSWLQFFHQTNVPDQGTFSLTISSTGSSIPAGSSTGWADPGGSLTMTLQAEPTTGATGTVNVTATF